MTDPGADPGSEAGTDPAIEYELLGDVSVRLPRRDDEPELLDAGPGQLWHPPRWMVLVAVLVALVGGLAWYVDGRARAHESAALAACRRALQDVVSSADLQMTSVANDIRPTLASTTGAERAAVVAVMSLPARQLLPDVVRADRLCGSVSVLPWHLSLKAERDATTAYSTALTARLRAVAADGSAFYASDRELRRLHRAADIRVFGGRY